MHFSLTRLFYIIVLVTLPIECANVTSEVNCDEITKVSPWEDQIPIHPCHYTTHTHPRQVPRKNRTEMEITEFHHLAIFNIRYDLDFQEAGDHCSVRLQQEWLITGGDAKNNKPVPLSEYSFNRIWYKRLCNFFSYLECIPIGEVRPKQREILEEMKRKRLKKKAHKDHKHPGALPDSHKHLPLENHTAHDDLHRTWRKLTLNTSSGHHVFKDELVFNDSGRNTIGMYRLKIGGRGPGKGRHKSGPGASRVDPTQSLGLPIAIPVEGYPLDGICVCSYHDPEFPTRKRPDYGMNFVEDEARDDWCVAAPGNLCGRVYFKRDLWPGQSFEFSDHIGCPRLYNGDEYECIRWQKGYSSDPSHGHVKSEGSPTATCEKKQEDPKFLKEAELAAKRAELKQRKRLKSRASNVIHPAILVSIIVFISNFIKIDT